MWATPVTTYCNQYVFLKMPEAHLSEDGRELSLVRISGRPHDLFEGEGHMLEDDVEEKVLGKEHPDTLTSMNNLARLFDSQGKYDAAEPLYRKTLQLTEKVLGKEHPDTLTSINNLALLSFSQGKYNAAEPLYRETLELREKVLGKEHPYILTSINNLAGFFDSQGKYNAAKPLYRETPS